MYRRGCEEGATTGCHLLASMLAEGRGVPRDEEEAAAFYQRSCELDPTTGCVELGTAAMYGHGVPEDHERAVGLFLRACNAGDLDACRNVGSMLESGLGIPRDPSRAAEVYAHACEAGDSTSCWSLAFLYYRGLGVARDSSRAIELYRRACDDGVSEACQGYPRALTEAAQDAESGYGIPRDVALAEARYAEACEELRYEPACFHLRILRGVSIADVVTYEIHITALRTAPEWLHVGDTCQVRLVAPPARSSAIRLTCNDRLVYPATSGFGWRGGLHGADDEMSGRDGDAMLRIDGHAHTFVLEDDPTGLLGAVRIEGRVGGR